MSIRLLEDDHPLTPTCRDIDQLDAMDILPTGTRSCMMQQIDLAMARLTGIPSNALHKHLLAHLIDSLWLFAQQGLLARQRADGRFTDLAQLLLHLAGQPHASKVGQVLYSQEQHWGESFSTHAIRAFPHQQDHLSPFVFCKRKVIHDQIW